MDEGDGWRTIHIGVCPVSDVTTLRTFVLGLKPYVVIELSDATFDDDGEITGLSSTLQFGGGISQDDLLELLEATVEQIRSAEGDSA